MAQQHEFGKKAEQIACDYLLKKGYRILERNYRFEKAEVDLIAQTNNILSVIEVKARSTTDFGNPQDFITKKKIQLLVKAIDHYVIENDLEVEVRFDVIAIVKNGTNFMIEHLEDAFYHY
ncbi:YraN family protein [Leptobacterium sp. I13]|uniref:YraN family protein n=1 Tax=Leptobacterium meishanense TaxID=3128904 RepID=UPI0030ED7DBC